LHHYSSCFIAVPHATYLLILRNIHIMNLGFKECYD